MQSYTPVLRDFAAYDIKHIFQTKPRMVCILTHAGHLKIYNSVDLSTVLQAGSTPNSTF